MANLSQYDEMFDATTVTEFGELPVGRFQCVITGLQVKQTEQTQEDMVVWELKVVNGDLKDRKTWINQVVREKNLEAIKRNLHKFEPGCRLSQLEEDAFRKKFIGRGVEITRTLGKKIDEKTGEYPIWTNMQKEIEISGTQVNISPPIDEIPF